MKLFKSLGLAATSIFFMVQVNAQDNTSRTQKKPVSKSSYDQNGIYVGVDYLNLTDVKSEYQSTFDGKKYEDRSHGGTHVGLTGFQIGYNRAPELGLGYQIGTRFYRSIEKSDGESMDVYLLESNIKYAFSKMVVPYAGLNVSRLIADEGDLKSGMDVGAQVGVGIRFQPKLTLNLGSTAIAQTVSMKDKDFNLTGKTLVHGFNSSLNYTF